MKYNFNEKEHLHLLDGKPLTGTTTILSVLSKPLTWWASGLAVSKLGWTNEYSKDEAGKRVKVELEQRIKHLKPFRAKQTLLDDKGYLLLLDEAYKAHSVKLSETAEAGTDLHAELERFVRNTMLLQKSGTIDKTEYDARIQPFIAWSKSNVKKFIGSEVYTFSHTLWLGGIIDCVAELKDGTIAIIDFKSSKEAYISQFIQCALYDLQITESGAYDEKGGKLFNLPKEIGKYIIFPFGAKTLIPSEQTDLLQLKEAGKACVSLYKVINAFNNYGE